ncbi:MAG: class I SAM-dependent methyltransferase [Planctomycetota bacterium]|jgi:cyclopropane-fatty-acyl-phospholipid synthase|nr:class I SAM-dependent methyltransferase [Planctomycetota bacterium]
MSIEDRVETGDSAVHYDSSPEMFELLLDKNMNYSSGIYFTGDENLDLAQIQKMDRVAQICGFQEGQTLLDMGCGWSGPARYYAEHYKMNVIGYTLSPVQREFAMEKARERGIADRLDIRVCSVLDAELEPESVDHVIFFESIIHMWEKLDLFRMCHRALRPSGMLFVQESNYDRNSNTDKFRGDRGFQLVDEVFGNTATMVSTGEMIRLMEEAEFLPCYTENISNHYKRTLEQWCNRIDQHSDAMSAAEPEFFPDFRKYMMMALATYRQEGTVCHMTAGQKSPNDWALRNPLRF